MEKEVFDLTILGAGPTGLFAAYYAGLRRLSTKIIDSFSQGGGQLISLYPHKYIYDVAGFPKIKALDLVENLYKQAVQYNPVICLEQRAISFEYTPDNLIQISTAERQTHLCKKLIITAGCGIFSPRKLGLREEEQFYGKGFNYIVKDPEAYRDKKVLVVGGGDSALDWALAFKDISKKVVLIHRSDKFAAHPDSVYRLFNSNIEILTHNELKQILGNGRVEQAVVFNRAKNEENILEVEMILCAIGFSPNLGPIKEWGLDISGGTIRVNNCMETNLPGVYAAGDIASYEGKLRLICTGFSDAAVAVNYAAHAIYPEMRIFPGYTSSLIKETPGLSETAQTSTPK